MRHAVAVVALLALGLTGCRAVRAIVVEPEELAAFRPTRTRETLEERMKAAEAYLAAYPDGEFAAEVRRSYLRAEEALWVSKRGSVAGLESYLAALPTGPHAKVARRELDAKRAARVDLLGRGAAKTEAKLAAAAAARTRARDALGVWIRRFADPAVFGAPLSAAPREVVVPWTLALPQPRCAEAPTGGRRCTKLVTEAFEIPRDGEREMVLEVVVTESATGGVCLVVLRGPSLFTRWEEAESRVALDLDAPLAKDALLSNVASLVRSTSDTRPGAVACAESVGHGRGDETFYCGPVRVDISTGSAAGGDDAIAFSTAYPCSSP